MPVVSVVSRPSRLELPLIWPTSIKTAARSDGHGLGTANNWVLRKKQQWTEGMLATSPSRAKLTPPRTDPIPMAGTHPPKQHRVMATYATWGPVDPSAHAILGATLVLSL
jgi:hypothetical protein